MLRQRGVDDTCGLFACAMMSVISTARRQLSTQAAGAIFRIFSAETTTSAKKVKLGSERNTPKLVIGRHSFGRAASLKMSCCTRDESSGITSKKNMFFPLVALNMLFLSASLIRGPKKIAAGSICTYDAGSI